MIQTTRILWTTDRSDPWTGYRPCFLQLGVLSSELFGNVDAFPPFLSLSSFTGGIFFFFSFFCSTSLTSDES